MKEKISVFGLGKLGCTMLACFASKGWDVIGMDVNAESVKNVNEGQSPIFEPGVDELIKTNRAYISATTDPKLAVLNSDISFVIVPTPSTIDGSFSIKYVEMVAAEIGSILREKDGYHIIVITSTVLPGNMNDIISFMEKTSGKKCGSDFGACYNPDFIALGSIAHDFLNPDMVLIGESDDKAGSYLEDIHHRLTDNEPRIHRMNFINAELAKISLNSYCTLKISFANSLAEICERMPGGDSDVVTKAIGDDERIGRKYLKGGLSYGGPCFPRDNRAFSFTAHKFGAEAPLAKLTDKINRYQKSERIPKLLFQILKKEKCDKIAILGLTYKKDTTLAEESASIEIVRELAKSGIRVVAYDPAGQKEARRMLWPMDNIHFAESAIDCIEGHQVCFIATPWGEIANLSAEDYKMQMKTPVLIDAWGLYDFREADGIRYVEIGKDMSDWLDDDPYATF